MLSDTHKTLTWNAARWFSAAAVCLWVLGAASAAWASGVGQCVDMTALLGLTSSQDGSPLIERMIREQHPHGAALCMEMGWRCDAQQMTPAPESSLTESVDADEAANNEEDSDGPCLLEEVEGRCAEADEKDRLESMDEDDSLSNDSAPVPLSTLALACFGSRSQCSGLPAPSPSKQLKSPVPVPAEPSAEDIVAVAVVRTLASHLDAPGLGPNAGVLQDVERPPWA